MRAISTFNRDEGMSTRGCRDSVALRIRVSMSAIGSVIFITLDASYQLSAPSVLVAGSFLTSCSWLLPQCLPPARAGGNTGGTGQTCGGKPAAGHSGGSDCAAGP